MEEIRGAAQAYHKKSSIEEKKFAESLFKELDVEGNGKIKFKVFHDKFEKEKKYMDRIRIFKKLRKTHVDFLDKEDIITLSFIIKTGRMLFCGSCSEFLTGQYFLCLQCYESATDESFYKLCSSCFGLSTFEHHKDAKFIDNDSLAKRLREGRREAVKSGKMENKNDQAERPGKSNMENKNHPWQDPQFLLANVLTASIGGWLARELTFGTDIITRHGHDSESNIHDATTGATDHHDIASSLAGNANDHNIGSDHLDSAANIYDHNIDSDHSDMIQSGADNIHDHNIGCDHSDMIQSGDTIDHLHDHFSYNSHDICQSAADAAHAHVANSMPDVSSSGFDHISSVIDSFSSFLS